MEWRDGVKEELLEEIWTG